MLQFELFGILFDWTMWDFEISLISFTYPTLGVFRTDSLFVLGYVGKCWYLELFFCVFIGKKIIDG